MSTVLGLHTGHESSAVLFRDGQLVAAISEERLSRIKNDGGRLPDAAIARVLGLGGLERTQTEHLALQYNFLPEEYFRRETLLKEFERRLSRFKKKLANQDRPQMMARNLLKQLRKQGKPFDPYFRKDEFLVGEGFSPNTTLRFHDHHDAHALPAAYYSGFERAAIFTIDGVGDLDINHTSCIYDNGSVRRIHVTNTVGTSAGGFYGAITRILGFRELRHEGKVIGLAAYGNPAPLYEAFSRALRLSADGNTLDSDFAGQHERVRYDYLASVAAGHSREDISAAAQQVLEDVALELIRRFLDETGLDCVALNGGVFANVKLNQRIAALPQVKQVFVFPAMSDTGNSIGSALLDLQASSPEVFAANRKPLETVYWGPEFGDDAICAALQAAGIDFEHMDEEPLIRRAAAAIHAGRVVGWFQGRMEFGPRALGNRSMLAQPTEKGINDWLNQRLDRSEFMPFAPSVLEERAEELFENIPKARHAAAFMTITFDVKPEWRHRISAVVHVDGTARPQLVSRKTNPRYHRLIEAYAALSGLPLVLNTSFNVHEEPIVCGPEEAARAFVEKRIDALAIGNFWAEHRD